MPTKGDRADSLNARRVSARGRFTFALTLRPTLHRKAITGDDRSLLAGVVAGPQPLSLSAEMVWHRLSNEINGGLRVLDPKVGSCIHHVVR